MSGLRSQRINFHETHQTSQASHQMQKILFVGSCIAALSKLCRACPTDEHEYIAPRAIDSKDCSETL